MSDLLLFFCRKRVVNQYQPQLRRESPEDEVSLGKYLTLMNKSQITVTVTGTVTVMEVVSINSLISTYLPLGRIVLARFV